MKEYFLVNKDCKYLYFEIPYFAIEDILPLDLNDKIEFKFSYNCEEQKPVVLQPIEFAEIVNCVGQDLSLVTDEVVIECAELHGNLSVYNPIAGQALPYRVYFLPGIFNMSKFQPGVYTVEICFVKQDEDKRKEQNLCLKQCIFMDCDSDCKVQNNLLESIEEPNLELMLKYFTLLNSGNCGCNCQELCDLWDSILVDLNDPCKPC